MKNTMTKAFAMICLLGFHAVGFSEEPKTTEATKPATEEAAKAAAEEKAKAVAAHGHSHD